MSLGRVLELPPADLALQLELERIRRLYGRTDAARAAWLAERAHDALDAELERREQLPGRFECRLCGAVGSSPGHNPACPDYRRPA